MLRYAFRYDDGEQLVAVRLHVRHPPQAKSMGLRFLRILLHFLSYSNSKYLPSSNHRYLHYYRRQYSEREDGKRRLPEVAEQSGRRIG